MGIEKFISFPRQLERVISDRLGDGLEEDGKILPARVVSQEGNMVRVAFELRDIPFTLPELVVPLFGPQYVRYPMQPGDKGVLIPADTYLGGVSGQGGGVADLSKPNNLSAYLFLPISSTEWEGVDGQVVTVYGPEGVTIRDQKSNCTFHLTPESVTISAPDTITAKVGDATATLTKGQVKLSIGSTSLTLTESAWSLQGESGELTDAMASTSPSVMLAGFNALKAWANSHTHTNGHDGAPTGAAIQKFNGNITG